MFVEMERVRAIEELRLFDLVRTAVNGDKSAAQEFYEKTRARAGLEQSQSQIVIGSQAELDALLSGRR